MINGEDYFLKELNAITNYANNSNTVYTESNVRDMLNRLLTMNLSQLSNLEICNLEGCVKEEDDFTCQK